MAGLTLPPLRLYVIEYSIGVQFAVYVLYPLLPFVIETVVWGVVPLEPVHPINVYPGLVGLFNVNVAVLTL